MAAVSKMVLLEHSAPRMFELVDGVEDYPQFLPWCGATEVVRDSDVTMLATMHINYRGIKAKFTTRNEKASPQQMIIRLVDGPFDLLEGTWRFTALGETACKIDFTMRYEFANRVLEKAIGPVFGHIANTLVDSFVRRADQLRL